MPNGKQENDQIGHKFDGDFGHGICVECNGTLLRSFGLELEERKDEE
jgi:hypothetical protein